MIMVLWYDTESDDYRFYKNLNYDVKIQREENHNKCDICFEDGDIVQLSGYDSLINGARIALLTGLDEIDTITYEGFGSRLHTLIKQNKSNMVKKKLEYYSEEVLNKMRRIKKVNDIIVTDNPLDVDVSSVNHYAYLIEFYVTTINDDTIRGELEIEL